MKKCLLASAFAVISLAASGTGNAAGLDWRAMGYRYVCQTYYVSQSVPYWTTACGYGSCSNVVRYRFIQVPRRQCFWTR